MGILGTKREIGRDTVLQRKNDLLFNQIDGDIIMYSIDNGEYYGMNKVASLIWELIKEPIKFGSILNILTNDYDISEDQCRFNTLDFINKLNEKNLIIIIS